MTRRSRPWYAVPIIILTVGIVSAAIVLVQFLGRDDAAKKTISNVNGTNRTSESPVCGNGVCENVSCLSTNCPQAESETSCPEDCAVPAGGTDSGIDQGNVNAPAVNVNSNIDAAYTLETQSLDQKRLCPIEEANLAPDSAVAVALRAGLARGTQPLVVSLFQYQKPLDQCVWSVKSFTTATSGTVSTVIDATQEVFDTRAWKGAN